MNEFLFTDDPSALAGKNTLCLQVPPALADKQAVLAWYAEALSFPSYFGANWDAFSECIRDLAWLAPSNIVIAHGDLPMAEYPSDQDIYLDVLADAVLDWKGDAARHFKVSFPTKVMHALDNRMIIVGRHMSTRSFSGAFPTASRMKIIRHSSGCSTMPRCRSARLRQRWP